MSNRPPSPQRRLLFLTPFPPRLDAAQGGSRVIAQLLMRLAERHAIALLCLRGVDEAPVDERLQRRCVFVAEVPRPDDSATFQARWRLRLRFMLGMLRGRPLWVV